MLKKLFYILRYFKKDKIFYLVLSLMIVSLLEVIGVGLIIPFVSILLSDTLFNDLNFYFLNNFLKEKTQSELVLLIISFIFIFFTLKSTFIIFVFKNIFRFVARFSSLIRDEIFEHYIFQDYQEFSKKDQSKLLANISNVTFDFSNNFMSSILIFLSEILIILSIFIFMLFFNFWLSVILISVIILLGSAYFKLISPRLKNYGSIRLISEENVIKYCKLGFQNIKELKIFSKENFFLNIFRENTKDSQLSNFYYNFSAQFPRVGIELFTVFGISLLIIVMILYEFKNLEILSILSFFGIAIFRMIPSINRLMFSFQTIRYHKKTLEIIFQEIKNIDKSKIKNFKNNIRAEFHERLELKNISFGYDHKNLVLEGLNISIYKGDLVGITGESGSGKSTFLDILTGLIKPLRGKFLIDQNELDTEKWQNICGYVSQNLFFFNDTLAKNIAFGESEKNIDYKKIDECIKVAQLDEFVKKNVLGVKSKIGENGINMSGGQRQRLAIARALYRDPEILILDEATNALDETLETKIINSLRKFKPNITIILVSHNKRLIEICNKIFELKNKKFSEDI